MNIRTLARIRLLSLIITLMIPGIAYAQGCPKCGCQAGHCGAGIPAHLSCQSSTATQKQRVETRKEKMNNAIAEGIKTETSDCNKLVQAIAAAYGYRGLEGKKADQIVEYLFFSDRAEQSIREGWTILSPDSKPDKPKPIDVNEAMQFANAGQLVIGVLHSKLLNQIKRPEDNDGKDYVSGHVFVVTPGGQPGRTIDQSWRQCPVANAGNGKRAELTYASRAVSKGKQEIVVFIVLQKQ